MKIGRKAKKLLAVVLTFVLAIGTFRSAALVKNGRNVEFTAFLLFFLF